MATPPPPHPPPPPPPPTNQWLESVHVASPADGARFRTVITELETRLASDGNPSAGSEEETMVVRQEAYCHKRHHSAESDASDSSGSASSYDEKNEKTDIEAGQVTEVSAEEEEPYHVFTTRKKWEIVLIVSLAGLFSPLSSNIYFPALGAIADGIGSTLALISLTVTIYMVVQGIAPSFWGPLSDARGRRVALVGTFTVYLIANISLALSKNFASMMVFRALQAAGSAATISVGAGVIGDITTSRERGGFMGSFGGIRMLGQSVGPVIGGIITEYFGFAAIFYFLFILGSLALLLILLFLPETLRRIAGNGSIPLRGVYRPLLSRSLSRHYWTSPPTTPPHPPPFTLTSILSPLRFLLEKDVFCTLFFGALIYTIWSMVTSSTTAIFQPRFGLSDLETGLIFLPNGIACVLGSYLTGKLLDRDYHIVETSYRQSHNLPPSTPITPKSMPSFPITHARLRSSPPLIFLFTLAVCTYGFSVSSPLLTSKPAILLPLFLQAIIAFTATAIFTQNSALVVDLFPGASASATAVNNLIRCTLGAIGVAVVQFAVDGMGAGLAFLVFGLLIVGCLPLVVMVWVWGGKWRGESMERLGRKEEEGRDQGVVREVGRTGEEEGRV